MVYKLLLQDCVSPLFERMVYFHDISINVLLLMSVLMFILLWSVVYGGMSSNLLDHKDLEIVWTVVPAVILVLLAIPSMSLLYFMDDPLYLEGGEGQVMQVVGHQWYWEYGYVLGSEEVNYDSFMIPSDFLEVGDYRLLEVDKPLVISVNDHLVIKGTSADVIHCWACPSLGSKIDVVPGRLNSVSIIPSHLGIFYGQCSEICGVNHSFMPIVVEVV